MKRENTVGEYFAFRIITSSAALVCCLVYAALTCPGSALLAIALYAIFKIVGLLIDVLHGLDQVNKRMDYIGKSLVIQGVLMLAAFCSVFAVTASLEFALASMAIVTVLVGVLYDFPRSSRFEALKIKISRKKTLHLLVLSPDRGCGGGLRGRAFDSRQFLSFRKERRRLAFMLQ
ncbi:MAG: hypothetical protein ACLU6V_05470 [Lancefieldella rimae]